jgi:anti-sigma regulatory factor (Ser/Thr protein kinase)
VSPRESNPDRLTRRLRGDKAIIQAADAARTFSHSQGLADDEVARLCIVIEELVANLYDHGGLTVEDVVELDLALDPDGIRVSIIDRGTAFDPWTAPRNVHAPDRGSGAGIDLIRAWAQFVSYGSSPEGNRLEFLLPVRWES